MSSRARRLPAAANGHAHGTVTAFPWGGGVAPAAPQPVDHHQYQHHELPEAHLAALEREAFGKGFAQGEQAGAEAAGQRGEAMLYRLTQTLDELTSVRADMIRQTERQMVQLALTIARRIVQREVSLDPDLLLAMARVALERLGDSARVTVRLHPEDYAAAHGDRVAELTSSNVTIVQDARLSRGGCRVESDMGLLDIGIDAQLQEVGRALLGAETAAASGAALHEIEQPVHV
jgi:flagellar assembly protein FliH